MFFGCSFFFVRCVLFSASADISFVSFPYYKAVTLFTHYLQTLNTLIHFVCDANNKTEPNRTRSCKRKTVSARYKCGQKRKNPFQNAVCQIQFNFLSNRIFTFTFLFLLLLVALLVFSLCNNLMLFMLLLYHCSFHHFCFTDCRVQTVELCAIISSTNIV